MATQNLVNRDKPSFKQQNLPAWQPVLTAGTVLPTFFLIGVAFVPVGIGLLMSSTSVQEKIIDYTDCESVENGHPCSSMIPRFNCTCMLKFTLDQDFRREVYAYYGLSNFYQNHRRYVKSRSDRQLLGDPTRVSEDCYPFSHTVESNVILPIAPCGAIANSLFNDTFELEFEGKNIKISRQGIAWSSDKRIRFQNPKNTDNLEEAFKGTGKPPNWEKPVYELDNRHPDNNGFQNEALMVWMRTAALPTFRKLYGILTNNNREQLSKGVYVLKVSYRYPVTMFNGRKRFIISNTSWLGGKNEFLGIAYIIVGCICFLLSAFFLIIHKKFGRLPSEIVQINQVTPYLAT